MSNKTDTQEAEPRGEAVEERSDAGVPPADDGVCGQDGAAEAAAEAGESEGGAALPEDRQEDKPEEKPEEKPEDYQDLYLRLRADFENFRKRTRREKEEWTQRCLENLCTDLLTVLDHYDLGLENARGGEISEDLLTGFEMVRGQLGAALGKYGLSPVEAGEGVFDPNVHEAITHLPSTEVPEGEIVAMTRKGYQLGNRLLRPAQVVVSAGGAEAAPGGDDGEDG